MSNQIATISFNNQSLIAIEQNGKHYTAMKPICENIGLDWKAQHSRIQRDDVLSSTMVIMTIVAEDGKNREMVCLPIEYLNGWLFGIDVKRVKPEIRDTLIKYKKECYQALHDYWFNGKAERQSSVKIERLSKAHQTTIKELVLGRAKNLPKEKQAAVIIKQWSALKTHFGKTYKEINEDQFVEAVGLLARMPLEGELIINAPQPTVQSLNDEEMQQLVNYWFATTRFHESVYFLMRKLDAFRSREQDSVEFNYNVCKRYLNQTKPLIERLIGLRNEQGKLLGCN